MSTETEPLARQRAHAFLSYDDQNCAPPYHTRGNCEKLTRIFAEHIATEERLSTALLRITELEHSGRVAGEERDAAVADAATWKERCGKAETADGSFGAWRVACDRADHFGALLAASQDDNARLRASVDAAAADVARLRDRIDGDATSVSIFRSESLRLRASLDTSASEAARLRGLLDAAIEEAATWRPRRGPPWNMKPARFWAKVNKDGRIVEHVEGISNCWEWTGRRFKAGYGALGVGGIKFATHRLSWELHSDKPIPPGLFVCHRCDNRQCVRPDHLFLGTAADNLNDARAKGRMPPSSSWRRASGSRSNGSKLCADQVIAIRKHSSSGMENEEIANRFNISKTQVQKIIHRRAWGHI